MTIGRSDMTKQISQPPSTRNKSSKKKPKKGKRKSHGKK